MEFFKWRVLLPPLRRFFRRIWWKFVHWVKRNIKDFLFDVALIGGSTAVFMCIWSYFFIRW